MPSVIELQGAQSDFVAFQFVVTFELTFKPGGHQTILSAPQHKSQFKKTINQRLTVVL